ncbi:excalibur calcium-binding domain-containing protein [Methylocucumis oryzae]|uniref:excalibur calcium-binding domain-containing protein n=1 Tax=Methylocucumis oryzae TaxID=1632867 RepID=UPI0023BB0CD7|nr:excalibur calcium-binding domain-containing protein [Methylocucumis oryzae]
MGWNYYQKNIASTQVEIQTEPQAFQEPAIAITQPTESFSCDGRQHCSQMRSRAEAEYFLRSCPNTKMDGDHDGIPCENDSRF